MRKKLLCLLLIFIIIFPLTSCNILSENTNNNIEKIQDQGITDTIRKGGQSIPESLSSNIFTYDSIIYMYKNIVDIYPNYTEEKMIADECDGIDSIKDKRTKEIYKKLFISGYRFYLKEYAYKYNVDGINYFGYAITDINKNGSEELILLTDLYDIIAVFSMEENQPKLLLDNYERNYYCRIDEKGRFYTQRVESSNLYTQIYSLNKYDNLVLDEKYLCVKYNYLDHDECYDITKGEKIRIPKSRWTDLTHGWVYGYEAGIITKTYAKLNFTRLFGELDLYLPNIYTWGWNSFYNENTLFISNLTDRTVSIALYDTFSTPYHHKVSVKATLNGNIATFDTEEISGRLEFGLDIIWLIIDESNISDVPCGTFLYDKVSYAKG